jgi:hypothetical protein
MAVMDTIDDPNGSGALVSMAAELPEKLDAVLRRALLALGATGETDRACRLAAEAWSILRHEMPRQAELHNALLHRLTTMNHRRKGNVT